ncbi:MAG: diversity-generating retroelement protein Avd [Fusobacteriaceae bacterium]
MNSLSIIQKTMDFELYVYPLLEKFPRAEKYAMITRVKNTLREIIKKILKASASDRKKSHLFEADSELKMLRYEMRLAKELKYISIVRYEIISVKLAEIGRMLGGWIKSL